MSIDEHTATVGAYIAAGNDRDYDRLDELRAPGFVAHVPRNAAIEDSEPIDAATLNADLRMITGAFPDLRSTAHDLVAAGDRVVVRAGLRGTFTGELGTIEPTQTEIAWDTVHIYRLADGVIAEAWFVTDTLGLLRQAGAVELKVSS